MMEKPLANANKPELEGMEMEALCINCQHTTALSVGGLYITISYINIVPSAEVCVCVSVTLRKGLRWVSMMNW